MLKKINNITIIARRWFQNSAGNTYHSVKVYLNGKMIGENTFEYGYDRAYLQTAHKILQDAGVYIKTGDHFKSGASKDYYGFSEDMRNYRDRFVIDCCDVSRRKDL